MARAYGFRRSIARTLQDVAQGNAARGPLKQSLKRFGDERDSGVLVYVAKSPDGGIPAASIAAGNLTPGTAACDVYVFNTGTGKYEPYSVDGATLTITVDNISETAVAGTKFIQVKQDGMTGRLLCDFEDCT